MPDELEIEYKSLVEWLRTDGKFGNEPYWHQVLRAARYCGVAPWEMEEQPIWMERVLFALYAEQEAARKREASAARRRKSG